MSVTAERLAELFASDLPDPHLVLVGGRVQVADTGSGGFDIASRQDLLDQCGGAVPEGDALAELAARIDVAVRELGG
jgi:hypothetical protein